MRKLRNFSCGANIKMSLFNETSKKQSPTYWTRTRISTVTFTTLGCMAQCASYSLLAPFYPTVARDKGNDAKQIGIVFSIYPLVGFISSPFVGKMLSTGITPKSMLLFGLIIDGIFLSFMSFLTLIESGTGFFIASVFIRLMEAIGFSMCLTCYYTLVSAQFPDKVQIMVPLIETVFGVGIMIGPSAGAILYAIGGYRLPFVTFGACSLLFAGLALVFLPNETGKISPNDYPSETKEPQKLRMKDLLKDQRIVFDLIAVVVCCLTIAFNTSTLALWIEQFDLPISMSSLIFLIYGVVYGVSSIINGVLSNRLEDCRFLVLIGAVIFSAGVSILGPLPIIPLETSPSLIILGQILMGIGNGAIYNLSYIHALKYVIARLNYSAGPETYALVSCLFSTGFFLGAFMGPIVGGVIFDVVGYRWASLVVLLIIVIPMSPMFVLVFRDRLKRVLQSTESGVI